MLDIGLGAFEHLDGLEMLAIIEILFVGLHVGYRALYGCMEVVMVEEGMFPRPDLRLGEREEFVMKGVGSEVAGWEMFALTAVPTLTAMVLLEAEYPVVECLIASTVRMMMLVPTLELRCNETTRLPRPN